MEEEDVVPVLELEMRDKPCAALVGACGGVGVALAAAPPAAPVADDVDEEPAAEGTEPDL